MEGEAKRARGGRWGRAPDPRHGGRYHASHPGACPGAARQDQAGRHHRRRDQDGRQQDRQHRRQALAAKCHIAVNRAANRGWYATITVAPNSPNARSQVSNRPAAMPRAASARLTRRNTAPGGVAQRGGRVFQCRVDGSEGGTGGDNQERRRDESLRQHDAEERVGQRPPGEPPERAGIAKQQQQQGAAGQRRQSERQLHQEAERRHGPVWPPCQQVAQRNAADRNQGGGGRGACQRHQPGRGQAPPNPRAANRPPAVAAAPPQKGAAR